MVQKTMIKTKNRVCHFFDAFLSEGTISPISRGALGTFLRFYLSVFCARAKRGQLGVSDKMFNDFRKSMRGHEGTFRQSLKQVARAEDFLIHSSLPARGQARAERGQSEGRARALFRKTIEEFAIFLKKGGGLPRTIKRNLFSM